jgi:hypothetical protein
LSAKKPDPGRRVAVAIICLASTAETVEPTRNAALAHAMRLASADVINTNLAFDGPASNRQAAYRRYHRHIVPSSAGVPRQYAAAMARPCGGGPATRPI